jgi:hypothetical protein
MNILRELEKGAAQLYGNGNNLRIDNIVLGKSTYTMKDQASVFSDMRFCLVLLRNGYGFAYFHSERDYDLDDYVNRDISDVLERDIPVFLQVALIDALYSVLNGPSQARPEEIFRGDLRQKAIQRARKIVAGIPQQSKVLLLGAATEIIEEGVERGLDLEVLDLSPDKIGLTFEDVAVGEARGRAFEDVIRDQDVVIASGMIFTSESADEVFQAIRESSCRLVLYMESGSNFGRQLLDYGADRVLAEYFPFYDFWGDTRYAVFEKAAGRGRAGR